MKRIATLALAAATSVAPLAVPNFAAAQDYGRGYSSDQNGDRNRNGDNNNDNRDHYRGSRDNGDRNNDGRRRHERWDRRQDNGYNWNGRWYYGPPPPSYYGRSGYSPGYREWRRGDRLPDYYRSSYGDVDYRAYRLRPPPRGYRYVRDDRGEILLVAIATGVILSTILNSR